MTTFRCKTKKASFVNTKETLHSRHNDMVKHFRANKKLLVTKKKLHKELSHKLSVTKKTVEDSPEKTAQLIELQEQIAEVNGEIKKIEDNEDEDKYYMDNGEIIFKYFQNIDDLANEPEDCAEDDSDNEADVPVSSAEPQQTKSVMDFFTQAAPPEQEQAAVVESEETFEKKPSNLTGFIEVKDNFKRA